MTATINVTETNIKLILKLTGVCKHHRKVITFLTNKKNLLLYRLSENPTVPTKPCVRQYILKLRRVFPSFVHAIRDDTAIENIRLLCIITSIICRGFRIVFLIQSLPSA
ncbi:hypothetical protein PHET_07749 [Paragonimus heterotremus]|uniref:Uncharacterized protein n=1 Tax=Paragonimus heterotremus TaxID=100268 RepID=A0A8J4SMH7_9TREM|nr:hypothetical protein PHET_07749 [Paragonimus heterotremus]